MGAGGGLTVEARLPGGAAAGKGPVAETGVSHAGSDSGHTARDWAQEVLCVEWLRGSHDGWLQGG